ncbi:sugar ABC transporter substrate-binding protein [Sphaerisporangium rufum]|uniref:Sugar ABC transporter substrate-binding protein n=2 Tax=Sphaerisporangium rufum TaxID=1381558 RepID=A0A919R4I3_9ACTN|nr:sugar ABC transporter substrate-binding protein [Sphaerisporangium rufum]
MAGLSALGLGPAGCGRGFGGGGGGGGDGVQLTMVWWGDVERAKKTQAALAIFQKQNPGVTVKTEFQDSGPYKDKLATRFAAGDPPDLMAMRTDSLREYADRGALLDLTQHKDAVDVSALSEGARSLAAVDGKSYGIPAGLNSVAFVVNKAVTDKYGVKIPDGDTWSWEDLAAFGRAVTKASGKKVYGVNFETFNVGYLDVFIRQRGEDFYTAQGALGVTEGSITAWFEMIQRMRADGGFPPAGFIEDVGTSPEQSYQAKGLIAATIIPTNTFLVNNKACGGNLVMLRMPGETQGERRGQSIGCPHLWSIAAASKHPNEALKLLNFLINDTEGAKTTGTTRGVPSNSQVADAIKPRLERDDQVATDFLIDLQKEKLPPSYLHPPGSTKIVANLKTVAAEVEYKRRTPAQAAQAIIADGRKALGE